MLLFRPATSPQLVRLVPAGAPAETPWSPAGERRRVAVVAAPADARCDVDRGATASDDSCDTGVPLLGDAIDAACDLGTWVGDGADAAVDAGLRFLDATTGLGPTRVGGAAHDGGDDDLAPCARCRRSWRRALARTPAGMLALDVVTIGRRFADTVTADCSDDASDADGTGGSAHRVMVVAGIDSAGKAWDRGPTVALDVKALGYHVDEGEVRYYSYAADGGAYDARPTPTVRSRSTPLRSPSSSSAMQREQPGREVDLIAHSQGGVVVDEFLSHVYRAGDRTLPPLGNVVTLSSPHEGAPLATAGRRIRATTLGRAAARRDRGGLDAPAAEQPRGAGAGRGLAAARPPVGPGRPGTLRRDHDRRHRGRRRAGHQHLGAGRHGDRGRGQQPERAQRDRARTRRAPSGAGRAGGQTATVRQPPHRGAERGGPGGHQPGRRTSSATVPPRSSEVPDEPTRALDDDPGRGGGGRDLVRRPPGPRCPRRWSGARR